MGQLDIYDKTESEPMGENIPLTTGESTWELEHEQETSFGGGKDVVTQAQVHLASGESLKGLRAKGGILTKYYVDALYAKHYSQPLM